MSSSYRAGKMKKAEAPPPSPRGLREGVRRARSKQDAEVRKKGLVQDIVNGHAALTAAEMSMEVEVVRLLLLLSP